MSENAVHHSWNRGYTLHALTIWSSRIILPTTLLGTHSLSKMDLKLVTPKHNLAIGGNLQAGSVKPQADGQCRGCRGLASI